MARGKVSTKQKLVTELRRSEILSAATKVFGSKGFDATRMEEIIFHCSWPGLGHAEAVRSLKLLSEEVFPTLRNWHAKTFPTKTAAE